MVYNSQLELVSTGICRGEDPVSTEELAQKEWFKYNTDGTPNGDKRKTSAEEIIERLGVKTRPYASARQNHANMFAQALDEAIQRAEALGHRIRGNVVALFAGSTTPQNRIPTFLEDICNHAELPSDKPREFIAHACTTFGTAVGKISAYAEENPSIEGYAIAGASEIIRPLWKKDNFDLMMFGDMAGVGIFRISPQQGISPQERGVIGNVGSYTPDNTDIVWGADGLLYMNGGVVMKKAPTGMLETFKESLAKENLDPKYVQTIIIHPGSHHVHHAAGLKFNRIYNRELDIDTQMPHRLQDSGNNGGVTTLNTLHHTILEKATRPIGRTYVGAIGMGYHKAGFILNKTPDYT